MGRRHPFHGAQRPAHRQQRALVFAGAHERELVLLLVAGMIENRSLERGEIPIELRAGHVHHLQDSQGPGFGCPTHAMAPGGPCYLGRVGPLDIHCVGEVWAHGLIDLRVDPSVGERINVDLLTSQWSYVAHETFAQAVDALVAADQAICGGADAPAICDEMPGARAIAGAAGCLYREPGGPKKRPAGVREGERRRADWLRLANERPPKGGVGGSPRRAGCLVRREK